MDIYKKRLPLYIKRDLKNNKYLVILVERIYKTLNAGGNKEQLYSYIRSILISMSGIVDEFTGNRPGGGIEPKNITVELTTTFSGIVDTGKTYQIIAALKKLPVPVSSNDVRDLLQAYIINKLLPRLLTPKNFYITKKPLGVDPTKGLLYAMGFTKKQPKEKPLEIDYNE